MTSGERINQHFPFDVLYHALEAADHACDDRPALPASRMSSLTLNEPWVQSFVSFRLNDHLRGRYNDNHDYITFETCVNWLDVMLLQNDPCPTNRLTGRQRFDLCVWSKGMEVTGLIEIKNQPVAHHRSYQSDLEKLSYALERWPKLKWGIFLYGMPKDRKARAKYIQDIVCSEFSKKKWRIYSPRPRSTNSSTWLGFLIRR